MDVGDLLASSHRELACLLCDELIGQGMSRKVFSSLLLPDCVIKVEERGGFFQNVIEWETWNRVVNTNHSKWFAQCKWISRNGQVLVMERTRPAAPNEIPDKLPVYLADFKPSNFGISMVPRFGINKNKGKFVCHDYGTNLLFERGMSNTTRKVHWNKDM